MALPPYPSIETLMVDKITTRSSSSTVPTTCASSQIEADDLVARLRERGVEVEYLLAEDEGYGFQNPESDPHFAKHLNGRISDV